MNTMTMLMTVMADLKLATYIEMITKTETKKKKDNNKNKDDV